MEDSFGDLLHKLHQCKESGKTLKMPRHKKNLSYDADGIYSYCTKIAHLDIPAMTIKRLGYHSPTSSRHYNYALKVLNEAYGFREASDEPATNEHKICVGGFDYWSHT